MLKNHSTFKESEHGHRCGQVELVWARNSKDFFFANTIIVHDKSPIIIDPSANFTYIRHIALTQTNHRVINTHYHSDHRALNGRFPNATFMCHREDAPALRSWNEFQKRLDSNPDSIYSQWVKRMWQQMHLHETKVSVELEDGDLIETEAHQLKIIHTPGHTPGLIGVLFTDISLLFTSDIDLTPFGPWYANEVSDMELFKQSVEKVRNIEVEHYITSHGMRIFNREQFLSKLDKFEQHFARREDQILTALREGSKTIAELTALGIIYRSALLTDLLKVYFSDKMILKHLEPHLAAGSILKDGERYLFNA